MRRALRTTAGRLNLGKRIGKGGEGEVFAVADKKNLAVKLYTAPDARREAKVAAMVGAGLHRSSPLVSFPIETVSYSDGKFAGFTMRLVGGHRPLHELYAPGARKASFPIADYRFLIRSATNIAIAISQVHAANCVIGDINHSGFLISDKALAAIIDADSFQFAGHPCRVGVPEYTPPELQGRKLGDVVRTHEHDAFGLAVVVFQLLFMGRHPFVGRFPDGDVPIERAIRERRFVYSRGSSRGGTPPPATASLTGFPQSLADLFEAAFGSEASRRPDATSWVHALQTLERSLSKCSQNELHFFPTAAGSCTWCAMEQASGVTLFTRPLPNQAQATDPGDGFDFDKAWRAIEGVKLPSRDPLAPPIPDFGLSASGEALHLSGIATARRRSGIALLIAAAALLGWQLSFWLLALPIAWWGYVRTYGAGPDGEVLKQTYLASCRAFDTALENWKRNSGLHELHERHGELAKARDRYRQLPDEKRQRLEALAANRRSNQLSRHLERFRIAKARIKGVGPGKVASLASFGIETAADVASGRVFSVPGFGPSTTQSMVNWRATVEARFRYDPRPNLQDQQDEQRVLQEINGEASQLRAALAGGAKELRIAAAAVTSRISKADPALLKAASDLEQAKVNLIEVGIAIPKHTNRITASTPRPILRQTFKKVPKPHSATAPRSKVGSTPGCPRCGSPMRHRLAGKGRNAGRYFLGCSRYPGCRGTRNI